MTFEFEFFGGSSRQIFLTGTHLTHTIRNILFLHNRGCSHNLLAPPCPMSYHQLRFPLISRSKGMNCIGELPIWDFLHLQTSHDDISTMKVAMHEHEWPIINDKFVSIFGHSSRSYFTESSRRVLEKVGTTVGRRGMGITIK